MSLDALVRAVLYEGYALYPYRPSALKNQRRFAFGVIYPRAWSERTLDANAARAEVIVEGEQPVVTASVRFLRMERGGGGREERIDLAPFRFDAQPERPLDVDVRVMSGDERAHPPAASFAAAAGLNTEPQRTQRSNFDNISSSAASVAPCSASRSDFEVSNARTQGTQSAEHSFSTFASFAPLRSCSEDRDATIQLAIDVHASRSAAWKFTIEVANVTEAGHLVDHEAAMDVAAASLHVVLHVEGGRFISAIDPPPELRDDVAACRCTGLNPVLAGDGAMLCSPIILPDFPEIAPQSPGDFFDGTEIDEMLTLRVLTMTEAEQREAAAADPRIAELIARTNELGIERTSELHGVLRSWPRQGTRVRLHPNRRADAFDIVLAGKLGTVASVERDLEGVVHCSVTIDDDPGADLGAAGMPGHRFYFRADELEVIA